MLVAPTIGVMAEELLVDFGRTARDYAAYRPGFPGVFFERLDALGLGRAGQRALDLGTGTGTVARGLSARGCDVVGLDPSEAMLEQAARLAREEGLAVAWVRGRAEATGQPGAHFDLVCAGQCWHWFDRAQAAREVARVLRPGGHAVIAYFSYLPEAGSIGEATEALVLRHNPAWPMAGHDGRYPPFGDDLASAGLELGPSFDLVLPIGFTHEAWRGRFRACFGVLMMPPEGMAAFDADLAQLLAERWPEPVVSRHRVWALVARKPDG